jgi:hypothetical protein
MCHVQSSREARAAKIKEPTKDLTEFNPPTTIGKIF